MNNASYTFQRQHLYNMYIVKLIRQKQRVKSKHNFRNSQKAITYFINFLFMLLTTIPVTKRLAKYSKKISSQC